MATQTAPPRPPSDSRRVGPYVLERRLGVGATATTWLGHRVRSRRKVCIKLLHPHLVHDPVARARLEAEAAAARVTHPGIVPVVDVHMTETEAALVFPFVEGETLAARLAREQTLDAATAGRIASEVAAALDAVHARGIVHRDVKPSNILLAADGSARLVDFGIAHPLSAPTDELTGDGMTIGTLPYMSPEQLAGLPPRPANDVFALGAVLYEMLAGHRPYEAPSPTELAQAHVHPPADVPDAPRPLLALAWAALARDAEARPTAARLRDGLRAWLDEGVLPAPPLAAATTARIPVPRLVVARSGDRSAAPASQRPVARLVGTAAAALCVAVIAAFAMAPPTDDPAGTGVTRSDPAAAARAGVVGTIADVLDQLVTSVSAGSGNDSQGVADENGGKRPPAGGGGEESDPAANPRADEDDDDDGGRKGERGRGGGDDDEGDDD